MRGVVQVSPILCERDCATPSAGTDSLRTTRRALCCDAHEGRWAKPCSPSRRLASRDSPGYRRSRSATAALGWTGNDGNSAGPFSLRTLAIVHGARGADALGCVTCTPKRAATRMPVAQSLSHQSFSRDRSHAMGLGMKSRLPIMWLRQAGANGIRVLKGVCTKPLRGR
jgi:hypothetical protein